MLNLSERELHEHVAKGEVPSRRVRGRPLLNRDELIEWASRQGIPVASAAGENAERMPSLGDALAAGGVVQGLPGHDKNAAFRHLVQSMPLPADVDPDFLHGILLAREALGSTAVGDGVAIPHPRSPILLRVPTALVTLCFLETPIDFGALDGRPVHALFTVISPTTRVHLHLLSRLAFALRDPGFQAVLARRAPAADVLDAVRRIETRAVRSS